MLRSFSFHNLMSKAGVALVALILAPPLLAQLDDVVVLKNGDRLIGKVKQLERGQLYFDTDYVVDPIRLDWDQVESLETDDRFQVELEDGVHHVGIIERTAAGFQIRDEGSIVEVRSEVVVGLQPQEVSVWHQLEGSVDLGISFIKDNNQSQFTLNGQVEYLNPRYLTKANVSSLFSSQSEGSTTSRHDVALTFQQFLSRNWFGVALADFLVSDQQDLDLRTTLGGGFGRHVVHTNHTVFSGFTGIVLNREKFSSELGSEPFRNDAEALFGADFSAFRFDSSEFATRVLFFPNLTNGGRYRIDFEASFRLDLVGDFYWSLSFFENFDSKPPMDATRNDLGFTTSFGLKF